MPTENTTKSQVEAYRFGMRRLELAVSSGQSYRRTVGGPRHGLSLLVGLAIAVLALAGFAVYGFIKPAPSIGSATVLIDSDTGGTYVLRDGRLYSSMNLASALLAAGQASSTSGSSGASGGKPETKSVNASTLSGMAKGQLLGITGAPDDIPSESTLLAPTWSVCDVSAVDPSLAPSSPPTVKTTAIVGEKVVAASEVGNVATLVTGDAGKTTYVLWDGKRSRIQQSDRAATLALGTDAQTPRPVSLALLNATPEGAPFTEPQIPGAGEAVSWSSSLTVGSVFTVQLSTGTAEYVVLADGVQRITPLYLDLIRASTPSSGSVPSLPPSTLSAAPVTKHPLDVSDFPSTPPTFFTSAQAPVICLSWSGGSDANSYSVYPTTALPLPPKASAVPAPPGSPVGTADAVYVAPGHGEVMGQVTGAQPASTGALFLLTSQGVKYPVVSAQALGYLGLGKTIQPASPGLLNVLPTGPTLDPAVAAAYFGLGPAN
ncbi:type VII secretion protein EccB [Frankineae bacterium MT45]|nr:type VII secretion protein EccB [Frankineae bacterium MT45]